MSYRPDLKTLMSAHKEEWGWPVNSDRGHYFRERKSLCGIIVDFTGKRRVTLVFSVPYLSNYFNDGKERANLKRGKV